MDILVTGGTGWLGGNVVAELRRRGHRARVLSRRHHPGPDSFQGNLATGSGLREAVRGVDAVIHAGSATKQPWRLQKVDVEGTRRLCELAASEGVRHLVYISIVGMEGIPYPYYRGKLAAEREVVGGRVPYTILRATQFPELIDLFIRAFSVLPGLILVPRGWRFQVVDTHDVAARLADVVAEDPAGMLPNFGGPKVQALREMVESWRDAKGSHRRLVDVTLPGRISRAFAAGRLLCPDHRDGERTWEDWLGDRTCPAPPAS